MPGADIEKTTFEDLASGIKADYKANARKSSLNRRLKHLRRFFGEARAVEITSDRVTAYVAFRQDEGAANATINRELAALKRMLRLGKRAGKVGTLPHISLLSEDNARTGFVEHGQFLSLLKELPDELKGLIEVAYETGWRVHSELLSRRWEHVDLKNGWLRLEPEETKNGEGPQFPFTPRLRKALERQRKYTQAVEKSKGKIVPWVFHRNGKRIKSFYAAWRSACKRAGLVGIVPHDLRRTAVRNLERAGVARSTAMKLTGHLTEAVYRRYAIVAESDLREGTAKLAELHKGQTKGTSRKVVGLKH